MSTRLEKNIKRGPSYEMDRRKRKQIEHMKESNNSGNKSK